MILFSPIFARIVFPPNYISSSLNFPDVISSPDDETYPSPLSDSQTQENQDGYLGYPPPDTLSTEALNQPNAASIPNDHIIAIYNDGTISEFNLNIDQYSEKVTFFENAFFIPPFFPENPNLSRIIGEDDRFQINDTKIFPWTTIVKIEGLFQGNIPFSCTGWMLGPSTLVTAGHCVYDFTETKSFAFDVTITPALNSDDMNPSPFGMCTTYRESVLSPWYLDGDAGYDYGVYRLSCQIGYQTGNLGFKVISGDGIGTSIALTGYPRDKGGTTMWATLGSVLSSTPLLFFYDNDATQGQSGGPVWDFTDPNCYVCVVSISAQEYAPPTMNSGPRINQTAFTYFLAEQQFIIEMVFLPLVIR